MLRVPLFAIFAVLLWTLPAFGEVPELACLRPTGSTRTEVNENCWACNKSLNMGQIDAGAINHCAMMAEGWCSEVVAEDMCNPDPALNKGCANTMAVCRMPSQPPPGDNTLPGNCAAGLTFRDGKCYCWDNRTAVSLAAQCPAPPKPRPRPDFTDPANPGGDPPVGGDPSNPGQPGGADPNISPSQIQADINQCQGSNGMANRCCVSDPYSCVSASAQTAVPPPPQQTGDPAQDQAAIQQYCSQLNATSASGAITNSNAGQMCLSKYKICENTCGSLANKYSSALQQAPNSPNAGQYRQAVQTLNQLQGRCTEMGPQAQLLGRQTIATSSAGQQSALCANLSQANPASMAGGAPGSSAQDALNKLGGDPCAADPSSAACASCRENPDGPGCGTAQDRAGQASFGNGDNKKPGGEEFNLPDLGDMQTGEGNGIGGGKPGDAPTVKTIANNSGGGIPGGGGGSPASLGGAGGRGSPGSPGYNTDVMGGFTGGGGGSGLNPQSAAAAAGAQGYNTGGSFGSDGRAPAGLGTDLKKYLPGGELDPNARFGGNSTISAQIHGKNVNIWGKISTRLQEKCRLGVLFDCDTIQQTQVEMQKTQQIARPILKPIHETSRSPANYKARGK